MATQTGSIRIEGTLNGVTYYHTPDGDLARSGGSLNKTRIKTEPDIEPARQFNCCQDFDH